MSDLPIGPVEIERVDIRSVWPGEARDFTPWLADNLDVLGSHLALGELEIDGIEVPVPGGRSLDILAVDALGQKWAIENQYGEGDHDHLTRALAYAVGLECRAAIVVAESHRDEFIAIVDEWNRYSEAYGPSGIRLFLAVVEAWRIGDSPAGYRFRLVAGPNEWKSEAAAGSRKASEADKVRHNELFEYWSELLEEMKRSGSLFRTIGPRSGPYLSLSSGAFSYQLWVKAGECRVQLRIESGDAEENNELFDALIRCRGAIEQELGTQLVWDNDKTNRSNRVFWEVPGSGGYRTTGQDRVDGMAAVSAAMFAFHAALSLRIEEIS